MKILEYMQVYYFCGIYRWFYDDWFWLSESLRGLYWIVSIIWIYLLNLYLVHYVTGFGYFWWEFKTITENDQFFINLKNAFLETEHESHTFLKFSSVHLSCSIVSEFGDPIGCSSQGFPVHHQLPELTQTHVHQVGDAIQLSHPLLPSSPPVLSLSQHQGLFQWVGSLHQVAKKVLELQLQHQSFQWIFRTDFL